MSEHAIRYRRPETPYSLSRMTTQSAAEAAHQVDRLRALGYAVQDVTPPLAQPAPGDARLMDADEGAAQ